MRFKCYAKGDLKKIIRKKNNPMLQKRVNELKFCLEKRITFSGMKAPDESIPTLDSCCTSRNGCNSNSHTQFQSPTTELAQGKDMRQWSLIAYNRLFKRTTPQNSTMQPKLFRSISCSVLEKHTKVEGLNPKLGKPQEKLSKLNKVEQPKLSSKRGNRIKKSLFDCSSFSWKKKFSFGQRPKGPRNQHRKPILIKHKDFYETIDPIMPSEKGMAGSDSSKRSLFNVKNAIVDFLDKNKENLTNLKRRIVKSKRTQSILN
ncbi:unnamed protein product [Moneuplotes crassus]|uniref:Uncharacterized protein n=1 Tax=Euplotes crassus TaxID=5936 RepID=A0AAD1UR12_EUPCR|nr:unnamed protein product [Moneuplotes crassus]